MKTNVGLNLSISVNIQHSEGLLELFDLLWTQLGGHSHNNIIRPDTIKWSKIVEINSVNLGVTTTKKISL